MNYLKIFIPCLFLMASLNSQAQLSSGLELNYGYSAGYFKDYNFSPLHYSERGHQAGIEYILRKPQSKNMYQVSLSPKVHSLNHRSYDFLKSTLLGGDLSISYLRKVLSINEKLELFAGLAYEIDINFIDFLGLEGYSWLFRHGASLKASGAYKLSEKHQLQANLSLPFLHILSRPPYNGVDKYVIEKFETNLPAYALSGELSTWNRLGAFALEFQYRYNISSRWQAMAGYQLKYRNVYDDTKYLQLTNQLQAGIRINL